MKKKLKVVYIANIGTDGGATKSMLELILTMQNNHNVTPIVFTSKHTAINDKMSDLNIENYSLGYGSFMQGAPDSFWKKPIKWLLYYFVYKMNYKKSLRRALKVIDWDSVDLIHSNTARDDIGVEISKITGVKLVIHIREFSELDFNCWSYRRNYVNYLNNHCNNFIAISNAVSKYWISKGIKEDKIKVIYNGIDQNSVKLKQEYSLEDKRLNLVIVGGVIPNKGQWQAVDALCKIDYEISKNIYLDVIGGITNTYMHKLQKKLKKFKLLDNVCFLGKRTDVYDILCNYDVGLMCSKSEGFGRVTIEYMVAGLAVIASNTGANPELINDKNGLLYNRESVDELSEKILELYNNRKKMIEIAKCGNSFSKYFTKEQNALSIKEYYDTELR